MIEGRGEREKGTLDVTVDDPADTIGAVAGGDGESGERATGKPNTIYNLASVLFHALQGGASYDTYVEDAEQEGDEELTEFFRRVREEDRDRAAEARMLLAERTPMAAQTESTTPDATATKGAEPDISSGTELFESVPGTEPRAEGASSVVSGDARREYAVTEMPDEDLTLRKEAASPRPEPTDGFPGTESVKGDGSRERAGEAPPPEEVPPERAGEIPMAKEVPSSRAEEVPGVEEEPPGTPPPRTHGASLDTPLSQEEMIRRQAKRDRGEGDKGLTDDVRDAVFDDDRGREGIGGEDRR